MKIVGLFAIVLLLTSAVLARTDAVNPDTFVIMSCKFSGTVPTSLQNVLVTVQSSWVLNQITHTRDTIINGLVFSQGAPIYFPKNGSTVKFKVTPTCAGYGFRSIVRSAAKDIITSSPDTIFNFKPLYALYTASFDCQIVTSVKVPVTTSSISIHGTQKSYDVMGRQIKTARTGLAVRRIVNLNGQRINLIVK